MEPPESTLVSMTLRIEDFQEFDRLLREDRPHPRTSTTNTSHQDGALLYSSARIILEANSTLAFDDKPQALPAQNATYLQPYSRYTVYVFGDQALIESMYVNPHRGRSARSSRHVQRRNQRTNRLQPRTVIGIRGRVVESVIFVSQAFFTSMKADD